MELVNFIFRNIWTFLGTSLLLFIAALCIGEVISSVGDCVGRCIHGFPKTTYINTEHKKDEKVEENNGKKNSRKHKQDV